MFLSLCSNLCPNVTNYISATEVFFITFVSILTNPYLCEVSNYRHSSTVHSYVPEVSVQDLRLCQVGMGYIFSQVHMLIQGSPVEIQAQTLWKLIGCSAPTPPPVLTPSSILPLPSSHCAFIPARKNMEGLSNTLVLQLFNC
jgi:hypothetical protein